MGGPQAPGGDFQKQAAEAEQRMNTLEAKIQAIDVKLDRIIDHFGVK